MKRSLLFALTLTALSTGAALAAPNPGLATLSHQQFQQLDTNRDGYIDRAEAKHMKSLEQDFAKISKDGKVDEADFAAWESGQQGTHMKPGPAAHPAH